MEEHVNNINQSSVNSGPADDSNDISPSILQENTVANMEVHHHPDLHHKKKKFKEYFLEFLMIFLAVTLGFFAESLREHISDSEKEHEYMQSFLNNIREDSAMMENAIAENRHKAARLDSLIRLSNGNLAKDSIVKLLYRYASGSISYYSVFKSNDATMQQLKNSGGLRFIKKGHVADSIAKYDGEIKIIYAAEDFYNAATSVAASATHEILDYSIFYNSSFFKDGDFTARPIQLLTTDQQKLKYFFNKVIYEKGATENYSRNLQQRLPFVQSLLRYLKQQYELE